MPTNFHLRIWPDANLVSTTRRFIEEVYATRFVDDPDTSSRIALVTHELLENAVKYSNGAGPTELRIQVEPGPAGIDLAVTVTNPTSTANACALRDAVAALAAAVDPFEYYQRVMRRNARSAEGSGLGLARIRAEGEMELSLECADGRVSLCARATLENRQTQ